MSMPSALHHSTQGSRCAAGFRVPRAFSCIYLFFNSTVESIKLMSASRDHGTNQEWTWNKSRGYSGWNNGNTYDSNEGVCGGGSYSSRWNGCEDPGNYTSWNKSREYSSWTNSNADGSSKWASDTGSYSARWDYYEDSGNDSEEWTDWAHGEDDSTWRWSRRTNSWVKYDKNYSNEMDANEDHYSWSYKEARSDNALGSSTSYSHPKSWRGNWTYVGSLKLREKEVLKVKALNDVEDLADRVAASMGDCSNLRVENTRKSGEEVTMKSLECRDHDECKVRMRALFESGPTESDAPEILIFRNDKSHSETVRGSSLSRFSTIKLSAEVRSKIKVAVRANRSTTPGDLYAKFVAPSPVDCPTGESEEAREYRKRLKRHVAHVKQAEIRQMKQEGFETVEEFSKTVADRHSWSESDWDTCMRLLHGGKCLQPGMIHLGSMIGDEHYSICVCPTAGVESLYYYARAAASSNSALVLYADGQASTIRGNAAITYTIGVSKLNAAGKDDEPFSASLCPVLFCLLDSENKASLKSAFECFQALLQRVACNTEVKVGGAVVDSDVAAIQALRETFGDRIAVHRCRWHRHQSISKAEKLTALDRTQAKFVGSMLERAGDPIIYKGVLKSALADTKTFSARLRKYLETSAEERFGIPYLLPVWYDDNGKPFMLTMALDNNISEAFNAVVKRKLGRRMGTGHEVYSHFLETSTILDALLTRGTFGKYDAIRLPLLDDSDIRASNRLPGALLRVSERLYLVASSHRSQQQLMKTDIKNFEARNHVLLKQWESAVLSIYAVRWLLGEWVCQCISFCQSGQCHHVGMVNKAAAESSATRSNVLSTNDDLKDASADPQGSSSSSVCSPSRRSFGRHAAPCNAGLLQEERSTSLRSTSQRATPQMFPSESSSGSSRTGYLATGNRRIADGPLRKNGRPQYWGPALKKNKTDTMPLRSEDQPDLPPGVGKTLRMQRSDDQDS
ncbi:hypothetical protein FOZ60_012259 [Perkinsus olseni]|uniref:MULE transposase domain-containing protein n=1 Tax=Perkinsus olseni TaxID=32597 RepID=A0A7J6NBQ7_PEROL|nr:hypothetical protein FOZ60_012259 [Perkinsus olseni]